MATKGLINNIESGIFNCPICLERFRKPKRLPCLHTFCQSCLNTYILSSNRDNTSPSTSFRCPLCRAEVKPVQQSSPIEQWAQLMPLNHMVFSLMGSSRTKEQAEGENCDHCERDDEITKAEFLCIECRENLCETCRKYHKRQKTFVNHRVILLSELKPGDIEIADVEEPCTEHNGEMMKVYCVGHKQMCCIICLSINHRKCENIKTFDEMAENMKKNEDVQQLTNEIADLGSGTKLLLAHKEGNIKKIENQHRDILAETSTLVEEAKRRLDNLYDRFKHQFVTVKKEHATKLIDAKERLEIFQQFLIYCEKTLKVVTKYGSSKHIFVTLEKIKKRLEIQIKELEKSLYDDQDISYKCIVDKHLTTLNTAMSSIAEIEIQNTPINTFITLTTENGTDKMSTLQRRLKYSDIDELEAVKIWDVNPGGCITSGLFLDDGSLMCVNISLKNISVYDKKGILLSTHELEFQPWGICQSSEGNIYVSDEHNCEIRVYTFGDGSIKELNRIKTNGYPKAIHITGEMLMMVINHDVIYSMTLVGLKNICQCVYDSGIAESQTGGESRIYHCGDKAVVCRSLDGKVVFTHNIKDIDGPHGVSLDAADNVYVCGMDSKNIFVIAKDGSASRVFLSNLQPVFRPFAIGFDKTGTKFFFTCIDTGAVSVYNLSLKNNK